MRLQAKPCTLIASAIAISIAVSPAVARADSTIKHPGDHPSYNVEVEPHLVLGTDNIYRYGGYGVGARFSIPIIHNGFVPSINNSVAITFGADLVHYDYCYYGQDYGCSATYIYFPVAMQWNFYVGERWSVFGEPGLFFFKGAIDDCPPGFKGTCDTPSSFGFRPFALWVGGRYHISESVALTLRIGWPSVSFGVSFFP
jgi:hypothetical protein